MIKDDVASCCCSSFAFERHPFPALEQVAAVVVVDDDDDDDPRIDLPSVSKTWRIPVSKR